MRPEDDQAIKHLASVSRETLSTLELYARNLAKWSKAINLVASGDRESLWSRHILDSAQLAAWLGRDEIGSWCDLGSGGGLPGLVVAIIAREVRPDVVVTLIESDARKAAFLRMQVAELSLSARVIAQRIETAERQRADVVSARALAPLTALLNLAIRHAKPGSTFLFPKGRSYEDEVLAARKEFDFDLVTHASRSDPNGAILEIRSLEHSRPER